MTEKSQNRIKKSDQHQQIMLDLNLRQYVCINELARQFKVSNETVCRDIDALSNDGLIACAYGGASTPAQGRFPFLNERTNSRIEERERIGVSATELIQGREAVMIDPSSTTIEMAGALPYLGSHCTVIVDLDSAAMPLSRGSAQILLCPGEFLAAESAMIGTETQKCLFSFNVDKYVIGSSALSTEGPSKTVLGIVLVRRMMLTHAAKRHLLIEFGRSGCKGLSHVGDVNGLDSIVTDNKPTGESHNAIKGTEVDVLVAGLA